MHAKSICQELNISFCQAPYNFQHFPFISEVLFIDLVHPGGNCDFNFKAFWEHLKKYFGQQSVNELNVQMRLRDRSVIMGPRQMADLILDRLQDYNILGACPVCRQAFQRSTDGEEIYEDNQLKPGQNQQVHPKKDLRDLLLERVLFDEYDNNGDEWKLDHIDDLLDNKLSDSEKLALQNVLKNGEVEVICGGEIDRDTNDQWFINFQGARQQMRTHLVGKTSQ